MAGPTDYDWRERKRHTGHHEMLKGRNMERKEPKPGPEKGKVNTPPHGNYPHNSPAKPL